MVKVLEVLSGN